MKQQKTKGLLFRRQGSGNYGQARYKLTNALSGASGYSLTENFKNAVRLLPSTYSENKYLMTGEQ